MKEHTRVFYEKGRYGGWPANHGIWKWGNEILISFIDAEHSGKWENTHSINRTGSRYKRFARSLDGGKTWAIETPDIKQIDKGSVYTAGHDNKPDISVLKEFSGSIDFTAPGFCLYFAQSGTSNTHMSWWCWSDDKGHTWFGPYTVPNLGQPSINTRTDYHILNKDEILVFLTCSKSNGLEGRVLCAKLHSDGRFEFISFIGGEPEGFEIMPATQRRKDGTWVCLVRIKRYDCGMLRYLIGQYESSDTKEWKYVMDVTEPREDKAGNPPALVAMKNGAWCLCYGNRAVPYGIRCKFSHDEGRTWGDEKIIRDDAACWDLGYVRMVENEAGQLVAGYYYNFEEAGECTIEVTIFDEAL